MQFTIFTSTAVALLVGLSHASPTPVASTASVTASSTASGPTYNPSDPPRLRSGGFYESCRNQHLADDADGYYLVAECDNYNGNYIATNIKLGGCFGNDNGQIVYEKNGAFGESCSGERLTGGKTLIANCKTGHGSTDMTSINLNSYIGNTGGHLVC